MHQCPVSAKYLGELLLLVDEKVISGKIAKDLFNEMWKNPSAQSPRERVESKGLQQITDPKQVGVDDTRGDSKAP